MLHQHTYLEIEGSLLIIVYSPLTFIKEYDVRRVVKLSFVIEAKTKVNLRS